MKTVGRARGLGEMGTLLKVVTGTALALGLVLVMLPGPARAESGWPKRAGGSLRDMAEATVVDADGNIFVVGSFRGTAGFDDHQITALGGSDAFVGKLDAAGNWVWVAKGGGTGNDVATSVSVDGDGNVYVAGQYRGTPTFGNLQLPAASVANSFVGKLDPYGNWVWVNYARGEGAYGAEATAVTVDSGAVMTTSTDDGVYVGGNFNLKLYLPSPEGDIWLKAPYNAAAGTCLETGGVGCSNWVIETFICAIDPYCCNVQWDSICVDEVVDYGFVPAYAVSGIYSDIFLAKLSKDGEWQWARSGGTGQAASAEVTGIGMTLDASNVQTTRYNIYVSGFFENGLELYREPGSYAEVASKSSAGAGKKDLFVAKLLEEGDSLMPDFDPIDPNPSWIWAVDSSGSGTDEIWAEDLAVDVAGHIYVAGGYRATPQLTAAALPTPTSPGGADSFVARLVDNGMSATWNWSNSGLAGTTSVSVDSREISERGVYTMGDYAGDLLVSKYAAGSGGQLWSTVGGLEHNEYAGGIAANDSGVTFLVGGFDEFTHLGQGSTMDLDGNALVVDNDPSETDYSVSLWFKTGVASQGIFSAVSAVPTTVGASDRALYLDAGGNLWARVYATPDERIHTTGQDLADDRWHHVVHTFKSGEGQRLYVDGMLRAWGMATQSDRSLARYVIGYAPDAGSPYFTGKIADVAVSSAKTEAEAQALSAVDPYPFGALLFSAGSRDVFVASLGNDGAWRKFEEWVVGQPVEMPGGTTDAIKPEIDATPSEEECFFWNESDSGNKLYPLWGGCSATIKWRLSDDLTDPGRVQSTGLTSWPRNKQVHVAGAPVDIKHDFTDYSLLRIHKSESDASLASSSTGEGVIFNAPNPGHTVLIYGLGGPDVTLYPMVIEVVETVRWDDERYFYDAMPCTIGDRITDFSHSDVLGNNGYVVFPNSYHDAYGDAKAYDRASRTGPIIPVNRGTRFNRDNGNTPFAEGRDMVVAWYEINAKNIAWPVKPVRYDCRWPTDADQIVIASQLGSDVHGQPPLDPVDFPEPQVYFQNDTALPGYNPNEEHAAFFPSATGSGFDALFALRNDLNRPDTSAPFVLLKHRDPRDGKWAMKVYKVTATDATYSSFHFQGTAGTPIFPPYPLRIMMPCEESYGQGVPYWQDRVNFQSWAKSEGEITARYFYPLLPGFAYPGTGNPVTSLPDNYVDDPGECVGWLKWGSGETDGAGNPIPVPVTYDIHWPTDVPVLQVGETLLAAKRGLPDIINQAATEVVYDEVNVADPAHDAKNTLVQLIDPLNPRWVSLDGVPSDIKTSNRSGMLIFDDLPFHLQARVMYEPINHMLGFQGYFDDTILGDPLLLLNVMSTSERDELLLMSNDADYQEAVQKLFEKTWNPQRIDQNRDGLPDALDPEAGDTPLIGFQDRYTLDPVTGDVEKNAPDGVLEPLEGLGSGKALTAGNAVGTGYVTLAFNNDPSLGSLPVSLQVIRVGCGPYLGEIKVIQSDNVFDEKLTLRHSGDFGGMPENFTFQWYYHPDEDGRSPTPLPSPETGNLHGWLPYDVGDGVGVNAITIKGASILTLSDNWFYVRYKGYPVCGNLNNYTNWAGAPGATVNNPSAQLAEGWIKRVVRALNAFEARVKDFHAAPTATYASMILQAGERYEGDVAMNNDPDNLNSMGLIEAYETVLRRGIDLSIGGTPPIDYGPANAALLLVASRISDFYALLGNEAYGDAADPTIGYGTESGQYGTVASSIFAFQNQLDSLLEEELVLLRGKNMEGLPTPRPIYNRLVWNFTTGEGEVAYSQVYGITDQNSDGIIDEYDGRILYPQGHGDAWGHYLTAATTYYKLLKHPYYSWDPRPEAVLVAGGPVQVDYLDERKFAKIASAKARAGAETVDLTYRMSYVDDPAGQWQGYKDILPERAWGLAGWGRRAGQAAYFDWVVGNAILPAVDDESCEFVGEVVGLTAENCHDGIQKIDRRTVRELAEIASRYTEIQSQVDEADMGLNPLGLARGVVPFDIDPALVARESGEITHFEQIYDRANLNLNNALRVFNFANLESQSLRRNQDSLYRFSLNVAATEADYKSRLIEIFGYPYFGDIGPAGMYPSGYNGPDLFHYMWIDESELTGDYAPALEGVDVLVKVRPSVLAGTIAYELLELAWDLFQADPWAVPEEVEYHLAPDFFGSVVIKKPDENIGKRRALGELQRSLSNVYRARASYAQAVDRYSNHVADIEDTVNSLNSMVDHNATQILVHGLTAAGGVALDAVVIGMKTAVKALKLAGDLAAKGFEKASKCLPTSNGFSNDFTSAVRCALDLPGVPVTATISAIGIGMETVVDVLGLTKTVLNDVTKIGLEIEGAVYQWNGLFPKLEAQLRAEPSLRLEAFKQKDLLLQAMSQYYTVLARGERTIDSLISFRKNTAGQVQEYRYQDMSFRIFRNDAIQKYRAQFDLAARYAYLAAAAYDYETNLLGTDTASGRQFLTDIVRERNLGQVIGNVPMAGTPGLADPLARMSLNFGVLKTQLGFNAPQIETNRFSLRKELLRIDDTDALWVEALQANLVPNLWDVPEFKQYCRPFAPEPDDLVEPGLVIPFDTTVTSGLNFFGWPLGAGDSSYDPSNFSTKVRGVGAWFTGYDTAGLSNTPRIYVIPTGMDVLRTPTAGDFATREWKVVDQKLPVPFDLVDSDLDDSAWIPLNDTLSEEFGGIRQFSSFRAYHDDGYGEGDIVYETRLVGRSVWNTEWLLIIPGATLYYDPEVGLNRFMGLDPSTGGVSDIKLFFETYGYSGN